MSKSNYSVDLIRQMVECDTNYIRLLKLVPQLRAYRDRSFIKQAVLDSVISIHEGAKLAISGKEPEKLLPFNDKVLKEPSLPISFGILPLILFEANESSSNFFK